jgi:hypothetical protein
MLRKNLTKLFDIILAYFGYHRPEHTDGADMLVDCMEMELETSQYYIDAMWSAFRRETQVPIERVCIVEAETGDGKMVYQFEDELNIDWGE